MQTASPKKPSALKRLFLHLGRASRPLMLAALVLVAVGARAETAGPRERLPFDAGWRFALGHASDPSKDFNHATGYFSYVAKTGFGDGPASAAFDDRGWRLVDLPHDWAVELPFHPNASASHGYHAVGPRFPENSVGWYRHTFTIPETDLGRRIRIDLDGVYRAAKVFVNGFYVGEESSGYLDASYDISDYLNYGGENTVAVRVDASMEEGWFYEGAGIYRHVWLTKTAPVHVAKNGTWVRTEISGDAATVLIETTVSNDGRTDVDASVTETVLDPDGRTLGATTYPITSLKAGYSSPLKTSLRLAQPQLWSLESPALHTLVTTINASGKVLDRIETRFGIRSLRFDPNAGFFLNGKHIKLKGTNNHQDHAGVGVALPDSLQDYRIKRLKEMGSNAYRASHNPPTPEFLDACDRLGLLVIDENRLMGSNPHHLSEVERMMKRDRNHPSVILWSLGNEEWGIEGNIKGARIATTMQDFAKRIDTTRPTTVAISGGWGGTNTVIEAIGVNYIKQGDTDKQHADYPDRIILGTEETTTQGTRGIYFDDRAACHLAALKDGSSGGNAEIGWKHYAARPYTAGVFFWTGFDYRGEATPFGYPAIGSQFGILDTCGFPKDGFFYLKSWWGDEPVLHLSPHWNWPGREGQEIEVVADSNCDEVELWLNGTSLGRKAMERNSHLSWNVHYTPGTLVARGYNAGKEVLSTQVETTGAGTSLSLAADRAEIGANHNEVSVVTVSVADAKSRSVPTAGVPVTFSIKGPGRIIGVGNGDPSSLEADTYVEQATGLLLGQWQAPDPGSKSGTVTFEATFDKPAADLGDVELLLNALGTKQTVLLNGQALYRDQEPAAARTQIKLDLASLREHGNVLRIEAVPYASWSARESLRQFHPASLRLVKPAGTWKRSTFNGLAQVIVQSTGGEGTIVLEATSAGLAPATATIKAK